MIFSFSVLLLAFVWPSEQSHFRGGSITAAPVNETSTHVTMQFTVTFSWRLSFGTGFGCDATTIANNGLTGPSTDYIYCEKEGAQLCNYALTSCDTHCIAFSPTNGGSDWTYGKKSFMHTIPKVNPYEASYFSFSWMVLNGGGSEGDWEVRIRLDSTVRSDTGTINTTPITTIPPIVKFRSDIKVTIPITWADADSTDDVRCRWAELSKLECGGVCQNSPVPAQNRFFTPMTQAVPPATLNGTSCMLTFDGTHPLTVSPGYYAVALQIEDFASASSNIPLSSIPLQFLIELVKSTSTCTQACFFVGDRPSQGCYATRVGTQFSDRLVAKVGCLSETITQIQVLGLSGASSVSSLASLGSQLWSVNLTWTPTSTQVGPNVVCGMATDSAFYVAFHCYTIIVGITQPTGVTGTPSGTILGTVNQLSIDFDQQITQTDETSYLSIYQQNGSLYQQIDTSDTSKVTISNFTLKVQLTNALPDGAYYVNLDYGAVKGVLYCKPSSFPISSKTFWTLSVMTPTTTTTTTTTTTPTTSTTTSSTTTSTTTASTQSTTTMTNSTQKQVDATTTKKDDSPNVGAIVGGVVGGVAAVAGGAGLAFFLMKRFKQPKIDTNPNVFDGNHLTTQSPEPLIEPTQKPRKPKSTPKKSNVKPEVIEEPVAPLPEIKPVKTKMMGPLIKNKTFNLPLEDSIKEMITNSAK